MEDGLIEEREQTEEWGNSVEVKVTLEDPTWLSQSGRFSPHISVLSAAQTRYSSRSTAAVGSS
jgi:hypothetical protein